MENSISLTRRNCIGATDYKFIAVFPLIKFQIPIFMLQNTIGDLQFTTSSMNKKERLNLRDALSTERDNRLAALQESKKRNCSVAELETKLHIANQKIRKRDNDNAELKRELKKRKIESKELTTTHRREKEDMKKEISKLQDQCRRLTKKKDELRDSEKHIWEKDYLGATDFLGFYLLYIFFNPV